MTGLRLCVLGALMTASACDGCREPGGPCAATSDCFSSEVCVGAVCRAVCNADLDCTGREDCVDGVCLPGVDGGAADAGDAAGVDASGADHGTGDRAAPDRQLDDRPGLDRAASDAASSDGARVDSASLDRWPQERAVVDVVAPDLTRPDAWQPDRFVFDAAVPDAAVRDGAPPDAGPCWYHPAWLRRWPLTIANPTSEEVTAFPVLLRLDCGAIDCAWFGNSGGALRIADQDCNLLPHEVERWSRPGESLVWFKAARLAAGGATVYLYGDPSGSTMPAPLPAREVWSNGFQGVYHLGATVTDSSPLANDGTGSATTQAAAVAGLGRQFNGSQTIRLQDSQPLLRSADGATVELWVNLTDTSTTAGHILLGISVGSLDPTIYSRFQMSIGSSWRASATLRRLDNDPDQPQPISPALTRGAFHHVVVRVRYAVPSMQAFVDGEQSADNALTWLTAGLSADTLSRNAALGSQDDGSGGFMRGILDEVRISDVARSDAWIALDHLSQQAPGIVTIGAIEVAP